MRPSTIGLGVAIALQVSVLAGMLVRAEWPRWAGEELRVRTVPVDPRSLFRGNYARLRYPFSELSDSALGGAEALRRGERVYVSLRRDEQGLYTFAAASLQPPGNGPFLRGRLRAVSPALRIDFGIEAFFAPKERALELERGLRSGGVAVLRVTAGGRAALIDVVADAPPSPATAAPARPTAPPG